MHSEKCRNFNADLGCTWFDEIHCFSDRDQVSFPYAMASMDIVEYDNNLDPEHEHRVFVDKKTRSIPTALILKSDCHYYFQATVRKCYPVENIESSLPPLPQKSEVMSIASKSKKKTNNKRVAIMVSGMLRRYLFASSLQHLITPLVKQGYIVDYYIALAYSEMPRSKYDLNYLNRVEYDPFFKQGIDFYLGKAYYKNTLLEHVLRKKVKEAGSRLKFCAIKNKFKIDANELILSRRNISKTILFPNESDPDVAFPLKDFSSKTIKKLTSYQNRKLLSKYLGTQEMWRFFENYENDKSWKYDYVLFLYDDTQWMDDFDMDKLLALGDADIYLLSCDDRQHPLHMDEFNDYALVVKRNVAQFFGNYLENLIKDDNLVDNCVKSVQDSSLFIDMYNNTNTTTTTVKGCNIGMILKYMIEKHNFSVLRVDQSYLPLQRSVHIRTKKKVVSCFHGYCQSRQNKIDDKGIKKCVDVMV